MKRKLEIHKKHGCSHGEKIKQQRIMAAPPPHRDGRPNHCDEKNRIEQAKFSAKESGYEFNHSIWTPMAARACIFSDVLNGDPAVLMIPEQDRKRANRI